MNDARLLHSRTWYRLRGGRRNRWMAGFGVVVFCLTSAACGGGGKSSTGDLPPLKLQESPVTLGELTTRGPQGQVPVWYTQVNLTPDQLAKIRKGNYRAAFLNTQSTPFMNSLQAGAEAAFKAMNIKVVATTNSNLDAAQQARDVQNVLPLRPNIILGLAVEPVAAAQYFQPAVKQGVKLVFLSNKPEGYADGKEAVGVVTYDVAGLGDVTADAIGKYFNGHGKIGFVNFAANFWITNQREAALLKRLQDKWPGIEIVDKQPMANPADGQKIVSAMLTKHPEIQAVFVPWDSPPAEGAVAALRAANRRDVRVFTIDLGGTSVLNMAECGNVQEETSTLAYQFGYTAAIEGALGVLGAPAPPLAVVPAFPVTAENLTTAWRDTFQTPLPANIAAQAGKAKCPTTAP
ncbi:MAG: periplasmic binding domain protein [Dactylosporangium sp.]|jgi:ribose transport system substrate-binding protein|nr:periplasmic binding domain protein [Dactylosporangium sp.]